MLAESHTRSGRIVYVLWLDTSLAAKPCRRSLPPSALVLSCSNPFWTACDFGRWLSIVFIGPVAQVHHESPRTRQY